MSSVKPKKRGWFLWVAVGLLVAHVAGMVTAVYIAVGDRTFVALPDYYSKSIKWDQNQETLRRSEALGWTREIVLKPLAPGKYVLSVAVADKAHAPVNGLRASATVYPELFPNQVQTVALSENADGTYSMTYVHPAHGPLVIELNATRGTETYVTRAILMTSTGAAK